MKVTETVDLLSNIEDYLREGADATEFQEATKLAAQIVADLELYQRKGVAYAWEAGLEFKRIKASIRRGMWTAWKEVAQEMGIASSRKIEMYMMINGGWDSADEASDDASSIVEAAAIVTARRKAEREGRVLDEADEAEIRERYENALDDDEINAAIAEQEREYDSEEIVASESLTSENHVAVDNQKRLHFNDPCLDHPDEQYMMSKYNMTCPQWHAMFNKQGRVCAICQSEHPHSQKWHIDHDYRTGDVRGILCLHCNTSLGWFEKRRQAILAYLEGQSTPIS